MISIDEYLPYELLEKEPKDLKISLTSTIPPILEETYMGLFLNVSLFHGPNNTQEANSNQNSLMTLLPSFIDNGE